MPNIRKFIVVAILSTLSTAGFGQVAPTLASRLFASGVHADTALPYSIIPIRATDNGSVSQVDSFGVHVLASYCNDGALEPWLFEAELPPKPPAGVFDFRFTEHRQGSSCLGAGLDLHLQEPGKLDTFKMEFQPSDGGYPMRLSWKDAAAQIATDWESLVLVDGFGGILVNVDMKVDTAVVLGNPLISTLYAIGRSIPSGTWYTIDATVGTGGTIQPGGSVYVDSGASRTFTIAAFTGYIIDTVFVDGVGVGPVSQYTFSNVGSNHTIHATFRVTHRPIYANAGVGGTITPGGTVWVPVGTDKTFDIQAFPGYEIANVDVDGVPQGALTQYTFTNVSSSHSIGASFAFVGGGFGPGIVAITAHDAGTGTATDTFGVHPNATYCLDGPVAPGLYEAELPPKPPTGVFDLRFTEHRPSSSCLGTGTRLHLQEPGKLDTFKLDFQSSGGGYPVTLSWPGGLASSWMSLVIRDVFGGILVNADMLTQSSIVVTNPVIGTLYIIGRSSASGATYTINASAGPGGTIVPSGAVLVDSGGSQAFTAVPDPGYIVDSISVDGIRVPQTSGYTFNDVIADHSIRADFSPAPGTRYRTFTPAELSIRTPIRKKPLYYRFSFPLVNTTTEPANGLRLRFGGAASGVVEILGSAPFASATTPDWKEWNLAGAVLAPGETVFVSGTSLRRPASVIRWNWTHPSGTGSNRPRFAPAGQCAVYPMPNPANVRNELFDGGFGPGGLTVGIVRNDSSRYYGWVRMDRGSQLQRSLLQRNRVHTAVARCFDFTRQKRSLPPSTQDNLMFANQAALKFNLRASMLGVTPAGLGDLIFQDTAANAVNGWTVRRIADYADSLLSGSYIGAVHVCESIPLLGQVSQTIERINAAFTGPMDTAAYASGVVLAGVRGVDEVPFLRENPDAEPSVIDWDRGGPASAPPAALTLFQNYPNPFNPTTTIRFALPADAFVTAVVYNQLGQEVAILHDNEFLSEGEQESDFDASALSTGIYFCRISMLPAADPDEGGVTAGEIGVVRMLLVK